MGLFSFEITATLYVELVVQRWWLQSLHESTTYVAFADFLGERVCNHEASRIHRRPHGMRKVITYCLSVSVCIGDKPVVTSPRILNRYLSK